MSTHPPIKTGEKVLHSRYDWLVSKSGAIHGGAFSGELLSQVSKFFRPAPADLRRMIAELRAHGRWSRGFAAAVFGVPKSTLAKWEAGKRNPSGAAAKLIFLIHSQVIERRKRVRNCFDAAIWGAIPTDHTVEEILLEPTYRFARKLVAEKLAEQEGVHPSQLPVYGKFYST